MRKWGKRIVAICLMFGVLWSSAGVQAGNVEQVLHTMSTEEKVGQLMIGFFEGATVSPELRERIVKRHLGGVILYGVTGNVQDVAQVAALNRSLQEAALSSGAQIPLFIAIDQEGGRVARLTTGVTQFPGNMALGATDSTELTRQAAWVMGSELRALGVNFNFAPDVDVNNNPRNPVINVRSFGESANNVARLGTAALEGYRAAKVITSAKHFPGHGDTAVDSHVGLPLVEHSREHLWSNELVPFQALVKNGVPAVMTAHIVVPALDQSRQPSTLSPTVLALLRQEMAFDGLIVTDSLTMGAIMKERSLPDAALTAFLAGADVLLFGADTGHQASEQDAVYDALLAAVADGRISAARLDASVRRILQVKEAYGLWEQPYPAADWVNVLQRPEHYQTAQIVAERSLTLVKNDGLLPLAKAQKTVLLWPEEMRAAAQPLLAACPQLQPIYIPLQPAAGDAARVQAATSSAVVVAGTYQLSRNPAWAELLKVLPARQTVIVACQTPYDYWQLPQAGAFIAAYSDKPLSMQALGRLLNGQLTAQGHLPVTLSKEYPRGFGVVNP